MMNEALVTFENLVFSGQYRQGDRITEDKVKEEIVKYTGQNVSRAVVRDLFSLLANFRIVNSVPGAGTTIVSLTYEEQLYFLKMRFDMEKRTIIGLREKLSKEPTLEDREVFLYQLAATVGQIRKYARERNVKLCFRYDSEFHSLIAKLAGHQETQMMLRALYLRTFLSSQSPIFFAQARDGSGTGETRLEVAELMIDLRRAEFEKIHERIYQYILNPIKEGDVLDLLQNHYEYSMKLWESAVEEAYLTLNMPLTDRPHVPTVPILDESLIH